MNIREQMEVQNKKNNEFFSIPFYPFNHYFLPRKILIEKEKKKEMKKKKKNADRAEIKLIKLNTSHIWYDVKILP